MTIVSLLPHLAIMAVVAALFGSARMVEARWRLLILVALASVLLLMPLLLPVEARFCRFLLACTALALVFKMYDLHHSARLASPISWTEYLLFLLYPFGLVQRRIRDEPRPSPGENILRLVRGITMGGAGMFTFWAAGRLDLGAISFALEYTARTVSLFVMVYGMSEVPLALWRLTGLRGRALVTNFFMASTPAEFWRRYNRWFGQAFFENVFKPLGGRRSPVRATLLVFIITAVMHEYVFTVAIGRIQGYQISFFLLQGLAVLLTQRWKPKGGVAVLAVAGTLLFNLATGTLFFASWCQLMPWYSGAAPAVLSGKIWGG